MRRSYLFINGTTQNASSLAIEQGMNVSPIGTTLTLTRVAISLQNYPAIRTSWKYPLSPAGIQDGANVQWPSSFFIHSALKSGQDDTLSSRKNSSGTLVRGFQDLHARSG